MSDLMNIPMADLQYKGCAISIDLKRRFLQNNSTKNLLYLISTQVTVSMANLKVLGITSTEASSPESVFNFLSQKLQNAVKNGTFASDMSRISKNLGLNISTSLNILSSQTSGLTIIFPPSSSPTKLPSKGSEEPVAIPTIAPTVEVANYTLLISVISSSILVICLLALLYFFRRSLHFRKKNVVVSGEDEVNEEENVVTGGRTAKPSVRDNVNSLDQAFQSTLSIKPLAAENIDSETPINVMDSKSLISEKKVSLTYYYYY
jgi:hypothetical protein